MSLLNCSIPLGAVLTPAGGTATTFSPDGFEIKGGTHQADPSATDLRTQRTLTTKNRPARIMTDGEWSKAKRSATFTFPKILANGKTVFPLCRMELEPHPEQTQAEVDAMVSAMALAASDPDFTSFWRTGNQS